MHFLPDVYVQCDVCKGRRYNRETLEILFKDQSIADVLAMTVEEGADFFKAVPAIRNKLETLQRVGLGYIQVGQQATTCRAARRSGSSSPRSCRGGPPARPSTSSTSRPPACTSTTCASCWTCCTLWSTSGNTVVVIEHNLEVIKTADWIVDLGPEGGDGGGRVVAAGTPDEVAAVAESYTGQFLRRALGPAPARQAQHGASSRASQTQRKVA